MDSPNKNNHLKKIIAVLELLFIAVIIIGIPIFVYTVHPEIKDEITSVEAFQEFLKKYNDLSMLIYLLFQILQVVIAIIPGQIIQIAGGYMFGMFIAILLSVIGIIIGTTISFYISRLIGKGAVAVLVGDERFEKYSRILNSKKSHLVLFILYLIPGVPKDMIPYVAGVSNIRFLSFIILSVTGRFPAMICSLLMGNFIMNKNYLGMSAFSAVVGVILAICFFKRKSLNKFLDKYYDNLNNKQD